MGSSDTHVIWISGSVLSRIVLVEGWSEPLPATFSPALDVEIKVFAKRVSRACEDADISFIFFLAGLF